MQTAPASRKRHRPPDRQGRPPASISSFATQTPRAKSSRRLKTNIRAIAFQVPERLDSRVILDENGAENLLGKGDLSIATRVAVTRAAGAFCFRQEVQTSSLFGGRPKPIRPNSTQALRQSPAEMDISEDDKKSSTNASTSSARKESEHFQPPASPAPRLQPAAYVIDYLNGRSSAPRRRQAPRNPRRS